jgi:hypothetical protein
MGTGQDALHRRLAYHGMARHGIDHATGSTPESQDPLSNLRVQGREIIQGLVEGVKAMEL